MKNHFKRQGEKVESSVDTKIADEVVAEFSSDIFEYNKFITIGDHRYEIVFQYDPDRKQAEIHFGLSQVDYVPITNAGLETFGKIADEISKFYEEVKKENPIETLLLHASNSAQTKDAIENFAATIEENKDKLNGLTLVDEDTGVTVEMNNGNAIVKTKNRFGLTSKTKIPISHSLLEDIKYIAKVDMSQFIPEIIEYIKNPESFGDDNKKQIQRLKLYQFYLKKRFPKFTFNSRVIVDNEGKKDLEFEKDEYGEPFLLVTTNN